MSVTSQPLLRLSAITRTMRISSRRLSTTAEDAYFAERQAVKDHAKHTTELWRKISFFVCLPATLAGIAWVRKVEGEHTAHIEHLKEENGGELPEKPEYEYMNKRVKSFPWGNNSLFFNPHANKNMEEASE